MEDHPRACGDHANAPGLVTLFLGSPPRLRGPLYFRHFRRKRNGITPAPAGTTTPAAYLSTPGTDHPRACGDHRNQTFKSGPKIGSPPRLRGPHIAASLNAGVLGITPAPAGTTDHVY